MRDWISRSLPFPHVVMTPARLCVLLALALCLVAVVDVLLIMRHRQKHRKRLQNLAIDLLTENHGLAADSKQ